MCNNKPLNKTHYLPVNETFYAFQGEGSFIGTAACFIRLYGCPVKCAWCDSANSWSSAPGISSYVNTDPALLAENAFKSGARIVVITGGEPTIYNLTRLTSALKEKGMQVHLETCGSFPLQGHFDWITVSPKWLLLPLTENLQKANELKLIVEDETSIQKWWDFLSPVFTSHPLPDIWLQPEYNALTHKRNLLNIITKAVKDHPSRYKAGIQLHKIYGCDELDK
jgi:organic radical activating enzyme